MGRRFKRFWEWCTQIETAAGIAERIGWLGGPSGIIGGVVTALFAGPNAGVVVGLVIAALVTIGLLVVWYLGTPAEQRSRATAVIGALTVALLLGGAGVAWMLPAGGGSSSSYLSVKPDQNPYGTWLRVEREGAILVLGTSVLLENSDPSLGINLTRIDLHCQLLPPIPGTKTSKAGDVPVPGNVSIPPNDGVLINLNCSFPFSEATREMLDDVEMAVRQRKIRLLASARFTYAVDGRSAEQTVLNVLTDTLKPDVTDSGPNATYLGD